VPMQGTAITMRPASLKGDSKTGPAKGGPSNATTLAAKSTQTKRRPVWPFIALGVLLLFCLAFAAIAYVGRGRLRSLLGKPSATVPTLPAFTQQSPATQINPTGGTPVSPAESPIPVVATALDAVKQNPNDPQANLDLSFVYWDAGQVRPSLLALAKAADLAGPDNTQFFESAGDQFKQRQAWIAAAAMYLRAIKSLGPVAANSTPDLVTNYHEALYNASVAPDLPSYLPFDELGRVEQPIALVAQARHLYYNSHPDQAHQILNQVKVLKPHMAEASLLEAEMDAAEGKTFEAKEILNILFADLNTPDWVRESAQTLSNKIP
jgi:hypothetical protein